MTTIAAETSSPSTPSSAPRDPLAFRRAMGKAFHSLTREHGPTPLEVEGRLPEELRGTLYRNGPALFEAQGTPYRHWLDGDGAITAVRLADGRAEGAVRVVVTRELAEERAKKRMLYGSGFTMGPLWHKRVFGRGKNPTNIHVLWWQGRLFAMTEMAPPYELDPSTLETKGPWKLEGALRQGLNAHVRVHPIRGDVYAFGSTIGMTNSLDVYVLPARGAPRLLTSVPMKRPPMIIHDLAMSERHLIFVQPPVRARVLPILLGTGSAMDAISWHEGDGNEIVVVPIDRPADVVRFRVPSFFHFHCANAFDEGPDRIAVDVSKYPGFDLGDAFMLDGMRGGDAWARAPIAKLERMHLDLAKKTCEWETVWDANVDFGITAPSMQGRRPRYVWGLVCRDHVDRIEKLDVQTGEVRRSELEPLECPGEPTFVPRDPQAGEEDDGWILTMTYDGARDTTALAVLDARDPSRTIARARFPERIPIPLHGTWAPAAR